MRDRAEIGQRRRWPEQATPSTGSAPQGRQRPQAPAGRGRKCDPPEAGKAGLRRSPGSSQSDATVPVERAEEKRSSSGRGGRRRHLSPQLRPRHPVPPTPPPVSSAGAAFPSCYLSVLFLSLASSPAWIWSKWHRLSPGRQRPGAPAR